MGKFEADGVKIDMLFGCPPWFVFPGREKESGDSPFSWYFISFGQFYGDDTGRFVWVRTIKGDVNKSQIEYRINRRAGALRKDPKNLSNQYERQIESRKSSVRSKVEHVFRIVKIQFGFSKVVYRGLANNLNRLFGLFMSANAYMLAKSGRLVSL